MKNLYTLALTFASLVFSISKSNGQTITSFTPLTAKPGDAVTITGSGFNTTSANNVVFLGATRATVTSASATSLMVTVPIGATYAPIIVLNTGTSLAAYSLANFTPTYSPAKTSITSADFIAKQDFTTGTNPISVAIGDLDGDGKPDLVVANQGPSTVSVYRNASSSGSISSSSFATKVDFTTATDPQSVAIGDLDGDGKPDLAVANFGSNTVSVFRNTSSSGSISSSSFATKVDFTAGSNPQSVAIGDLDGDGKPDLVVANFGSSTVSVFHNTSSSGSISSSSFATKVDFTTGTSPVSVAIGDVDVDGKPDLVVANYNSATVSVYRNTSSSGSISSSSFAAKVDFTTGSNPISVAIGDLDGDGMPDLAVANSSPNTVSIYRNTSSSGSISSSSFAAKVDFTTGTDPRSVAIGDLDGDGKPDLAVANYNPSTVSIFRNISSSGSISSSSFAAKVDYTTGTSPRSVIIGDLDGDGKPDLAVANAGSTSVSVLRNADLPPTITSFTPLTAKPGDAVTITGTGFNTTAANNVVFLGATKATVTAASATSLTVTVPTGATYAPITVLNTGASLAAYSMVNFTPTYSPAKTNITSTDFLAKQDFTAGTIPISVALGDLDGDGKPDLAVANRNSNKVSVFRNTSISGSISSSSFAAKVDFTTGSQPYSVAIGDLDGDGKLDLVVANGSSNTVSVFRNTSSSGSISSSSFAAKVDFTAGSNPQSVAIGDLDGDGKPDLVTANRNSTTVSVFRNTSSSGSISSSSFATKVDFTTGSNPRSVAIGDMDGDGKPDLALANAGLNTVSVFRNTSSSGSISSSSFAAKVDFTTGSQPISVAIGDLDGDGKPDLAVANYTSNTVSLYRNTSSSGSISSGSFATKVDFPTGSFPQSVAIGDLDGDGKPDLALANEFSSTVSVYRNTSSSGSISSSSFATKVDFPTGTDPISVAIGDLDGDGKSDLALANQGSNTVSIFRNMDLPPTITSFTPLTAKPGDAVTITGTGFNTTAANNLVFLGATRATVTAASAISLTVTVPTGATYAPITVLNTSASLAAYSLANFTPTYSPAKTSITSTDFLAKQDFTTGSEPYSVAIGDLDGDGKPDLAVANFNSNIVSVYRNTSNSGSINSSSFATKVDFTTGSFSNPRSVAIGDMDGDGKLDLVTANRSSNKVSVFRNTSSSGSISSSSFAAKVDFTTGSNPYSVAIGDLDGDGKPDLAVANLISNTVSVFRNTSSNGSISSSSFATKVDFTTGSNPFSVAIGDLDGDGKPDLAVANEGSNTVSVFRNTSSSNGSISSSSFAAKVDFTTGNDPESVVIGDLDGDGKPDLAVANQGSDTVSVFRNTSTSGSISSSSFAAKVDFITGSSPRSVAIGDLDGDGKPDLAVANSGSTTVSVYRNTSSSGSISSSSFATKVDFTTGTGPVSLAIGDLDGDGKPDLAVGNNSSTSVSIFRNADIATPTVILMPSTLNGVKLTRKATLGSSIFYGDATDNYFAIDTAGITSGALTGDTVTIQVNTTIDSFKSSNGANKEHAMFLMPRYWDAKGSFTGTVKVRFPYLPSDTATLTTLRDSAWARLKRTNMNTLAVKTPYLEWFKTVGVPYNSAYIATIVGNKFPSTIFKPTVTYGVSGGVNYVELGGITSFSGGGAGLGFGPGAGSGVGLPVTWAGFDVKTLESGNELIWKTASEQNTSHFEVEYSYNAKDWYSTGDKILAAGYSANLLEYRFIHPDFESFVYYRIKQQDLDGQFDYSEIKLAKRTKGKEFQVSVYPTQIPENGRVTFEAKNIDKSQISLSIMDVSGKAIYTNSYIPTSNSLREELELYLLSSGVYFIEISNGQGKEVVKVVR